MDFGLGKGHRSVLQTQLTYPGQLHGKSVVPYRYGLDPSKSSRKHCNARYQLLVAEDEHSPSEHPCPSVAAPICADSVETSINVVDLPFRQESTPEDGDGYAPYYPRGYHECNKYTNARDIGFRFHVYTSFSYPFAGRRCNDLYDGLGIDDEIMWTCVGRVCCRGANCSG